ncbi:hypothetical protein HY450_01685 [Candidatus Pacearchaeota archaeon]|nr:hypothetical protein [Candidatus Pacearchaeota archaeon]
MSRLNFSSSGRLISVDKQNLNYYAKKQNNKLRTSESLEFLKETEKKVENIFEKTFWSLHRENSPLQPLKFSNGKTQEDVVKEIHDLIRQGNRIIFLHGVCGTGKSAIALNLARIFGKTSVVVPVKALQTQYEKDYTGNKYLLKTDGKKMKIAVITGRENHDSIILQGVSCAHPLLPDTIKLTEKNHGKIMEYYKSNPLIKNKNQNDPEKLKRISIAPANPYWSPIIVSDYEASNLTDAKKYEYMGCDSKKYIFYHRKSGCSYYDQYLSYTKADVIIFNAAKYSSELSLGRKPLTEVDIIDEADVYLDNLFEQSELNLTWLSNALKILNIESPSAQNSVSKIRELILSEEKNKQATGINESQIFKIEDTKIKQILKILNSDAELQSEILIDELNYSNKALEVAKEFSEYLEDVYLSYRREEENLFVKLVSTNLSYKIKDLLSKTKALVFMSGTLHSKEVLKNIFQIVNYKLVEAETLNPGSIEIIMTGKEIDCSYSNLKENHSREDYLSSLSDCVEKSISPTLIHVQAFNDLPSEEEKANVRKNNLMSREELYTRQSRDRFGKEVEDFKTGKFQNLFSTKCARGVDFPGKTCNSIIFTKYPNPNIRDTFWKVIQKTRPEYYWQFYKDKARREFLQRLFRAIRFKDDHVYVLSPDIRVINEVRKIQNSAGNNIIYKI